MGEFAETVSRGGRMSLWLAEQILKDVGPEIFARKPSPGGKVINTNHPAFIFGHLSLYPARWMTVAGLDPAPAATPPGFEVLFKAGVDCHDDPVGTIYPPMKQITEAFFTAHKAALERLPSVSDDVCRSPNPGQGRIRELYPTIGGMLMFYASCHMMMHLGQASAWRRCLGLGPEM